MSASSNNASHNSALEQLRDIHAPDVVSAWPPAIGWYIVAALLLLITYICFRVVKRELYRRKMGYRRHALVGLSARERTYKKDNNASSYLQSLNALLKQVAIAAYGRESVSALSGKQWIEFLNSRFDVAQKFDSSLVDYLYSAKAVPSTELNKITKTVTLWVKKHKTDTEGK